MRTCLAPRTETAAAMAISEPASNSKKTIAGIHRTHLLVAHCVLRLCFRYLSSLMAASLASRSPSASSLAPWSSLSLLLNRPGVVASRYVGGGGSCPTNGSNNGVEDSLYGDVRGDARRRGEMMICGRDDRLLALAVSINMFPFLIKDVIREVMKWNSTVNVRSEEKLERMWGDRTGQEKGQAVMSYCA
jgi:hypothetical protein